MSRSALLAVLLLVVPRLAIGAAPAAPEKALAPGEAPAPGKAPAPAKSPAWVLPAGQEAVVTALFTVPELGKPLAIAIEQSRIKATFVDGRVLFAEHPSAHEGGAVVAKTDAVVVRRGSGVWADADLARVAAHVKTAKPPRWAKPASRDPKPEVATRDPKRDRRLDDLLQQAEEALGIDETAKAGRLLDAVVKAAPTAPARRVRLGDLLVRAGRKEAGLKLLRETTASLAKEAAARPDLQPVWADALARLDPAQATTLAQQHAGKGDAKAACSWSIVAYTLAARGEAAGATKVAEAIVARAPKCARAWLALGAAVPQGEERWKHVLAIADRALAHLPENLPLLHLKAGALHAGWRNREAAEVWEKVARKDINFPGVMGMLATAWTQLPGIRGDDFLAPLEARLAKDPKDVITRYIIGTASYYRGDFEAVIRYLDPLRAVVPREPRVHLYTAMAHFHLGHVDVAKQRLAALEGFGHSDPDYYYCRSVMTRETDFEGSLRDLETFVRLSKNRQNSPEKVFKMHRELEVMRSGRLPTKFDLLPDWLRWAIIAGGALLVLGGAALIVRRRRA